MKTNRMEAFSDGVLAIIITIMVLELKPPEIIDKEAFKILIPTLISYILSFIYVGIYWNNHHHLLYKLSRLNGQVLWSNLHWLFWMSLIPFSTAWVGMNPLETVPTIFYGVILLFCGISYLLLQRKVVHCEGRNSDLAKEIGYDWKGKITMLLYATGIIFAFWVPLISYIIYFVVAIGWFIPDSRIEKTIMK
ncbi:TMEM175 family protein [Marinilactibacillus sp. GCM10026970]|uniref:TMEM175 family protein n=1 Tax=Marinilactibacillus sp. GCM10026970 TaxID=3252642 RepID=UPI0036112BDA